MNMDGITVISNNFVSFLVLNVIALIKTQILNSKSIFRKRSKLTIRQT
jgi:hypothetical protein